MPITTGDEEEFEDNLEKEMERIDGMTIEEAEKEFPWLLPDGSSDPRKKK